MDQVLKVLEVAHIEWKVIKGAIEDTISLIMEGGIIFGTFLCYLIRFYG